MPRLRKKRIKTNRLKSKQNNKKSSYKQIATITKGFSKLHWGKCLFPDYRELSGPKVSRKRINRAKRTAFMRFGSRTTVFTSGEGNGLISGDFCSVKILRHRRGSNTRSSLYESDALPLGHCALFGTK